MCQGSRVAAAGDPGELKGCPRPDRLSVATLDGKLDYAAIRPLARVGYHDFTSFSETFTMPIPGADGAAAAGLEGKD